MIADELRGILRAHLGAGVSYAEPPVKLVGGFFSENHAFRLASAASPWDGPLVLRLFPRFASADQPRREATMQRVVSEQGYPAPRVLYLGEGVQIGGRPFLVMERLPGRTLVGGSSAREVIRSSPSLLARLPRLTADLQLALHRLDPTPVVDALGERAAGVDRWLDRLEVAVATTAPGIVEGLEWLQRHRPPRGHPVICHGDLWPGNILAVGRQVTGVIDWSVATVADRAFEVGFTRMAYTVAPVDAPAIAQSAAARGGGWVAGRYLRSYTRSRDVDMGAVAYFEALRCAEALCDVMDYRRTLAMGVTPDRPRPAWDAVAPRMVRFFRARTGVTPRLSTP